MHGDPVGGVGSMVWLGFREGWGGPLPHADFVADVHLI